MSREIKFNAFVKGLGIVQDISIHNPENNGEYRWFIHIEELQKQFPSIDFEDDNVLDKYDFTPGEDFIYGCSPVVQFTGMKDNKGVEIYEGDIVNKLSPNDKGMNVVYENGSFVCYHRFGRWGLLSRCFDADITAMGYKCEVIGNIHQHPELVNHA